MSTFAFDHFYAKFQEHFRGNENIIKERLREYLPILQQLPPSILQQKVIDLGCGNGLWLDVLQEQNIPNYGIDTNAASLQLAQKKGHQTIQANVLEHLRTLPDQSVGVVTAFHLIEHLNFLDFITLSQEILRILVPAGIVIYETPNPRNLIIGACNFYTDPTHLRPIPSDFCGFVMEYLGFTNIKIKEGQNFREFTTQQLNHLQNLKSKSLKQSAKNTLKKIPGLKQLGEMHGLMKRHLQNSNDYGVIASKS
jgi:O-antigen chain-terminating methyltransferase